jgi:hypothetical protein
MIPKCLSQLLHMKRIVVEKCEASLSDTNDLPG